MPTRGPGTAGGIAQQSIRDGADLILVAGGDGTVNEALNGIVPASVPLGIIPTGTANVLACELGLRGGMARVARQVSEWVPRRVSVGLLRTGSGAISRYFLLMAGIGFDAHIVYSLDPALKKQHGKLSYWITGLREMGRKLEQFEVRAGDRSYSCSFALASRVRNYGGTFEIARQASILRDDFALVLLAGANSLRYLQYLAGVVTGKLEGMKGISTLHARSIEVYGPAHQRVYVQVDGEAAGRLPATIEIVPDALTLLVPPAFKG